ncbi:FtsX-like permease family protein [Plantactinospora sp. B5E13]|uniref:FtsX-like permease family protein n=1 Tax=unclassified Plantactinospora TaxID=2631981 RepID=UPI00325C908D
MRPGVLLRLALAGSRTDTVRVVLTGLSAALATLAILAALTVLAIPTVLDGGSNVSPQYRNPLIAEAGLRVGVAATLVLLTIPVLVLAGQCARLGAPARDRRLAAYRMAGAGPRQAVAIAATEAALASGLGALAGLGLHLVGRQLLGTPGADGKLALPTDVLPPVWQLAVVVAGVPVLAGLIAMLLLRRVVLTPYGVVRRVRTRPPRPWAGLLILGGLGTAALLPPLAQYLDRSGRSMPYELFGLVVLVAELAVTLGVIVGTGWISHVTGRLLHRFARRPAGLLAARRLTADPWTGSRTLAALLAAVLFGAFAAGLRIRMSTEFAAEAEYARRSAEVSGLPYEPWDTTFYQGAYDLVYLALTIALVIAAGGLLVALAESIVSRRRAMAALVATGVPRAVLGRALAWQTLTPAVAGIVLAAGTGITLQRGLYDREVSSGWGTVCREASPTDCVELPAVVRTVPLPLDDLAGFVGVALAVVLSLLLVNLLLLRTSTAVEELRAT